ncbi:MAG TPA: homoserine kinase [Coriobacteriia bacterium]
MAPDPVTVTVRVPATTANLGSGYDAFGLALQRHNAVRATLADVGMWTVSAEGQGASTVSGGAGNLVAVSMARLFERIGLRAGAAIECVNTIPFGRGLGSSSAAIVGGLVAANELTGRALSADELFALAAEIEGHPDNVAAALFGGFTVCWSQDGASRAARVDPPGGIAAVVVVSDEPLSTKRSRELLPHDVPHVDAAFDAGRAGLLAIGIASGRRDLIGPGMNDRLHEQYRAVAVTDLAEVRRALLEAGADGAALSGAGPSVIGIVTGTDDADAETRAAEVAARAAELLKDVPGRRAPQVLALDRVGAVAVS